MNPNKLNETIVSAIGRFKNSNKVLIIYQSLQNLSVTTETSVIYISMV